MRLEWIEPTGIGGPAAEPSKPALPKLVAWTPNGFTGWDCQWQALAAAFEQP